MKKRQIIFPQTQWDIVTTHFSAKADLEQAAFAFARECQSPERLRLLVNEILPISPEELEAQTGGHVIPSAKTIKAAIRKAVESSRCIVYLHNHLWHGENRFSATDIATIEKNFLWGWENFRLLQAAVVTAKDAGMVDGLVWSPSEEEVVPIDELHIVGHPFSIYIPFSAKKRLWLLDELAGQQAIPRPENETLLAMADRQTRAFGLPLQRTLSKLRVGIVGVSGTGSHLYTELARLGIEDFCLCDPDFIALENMDRVIGATYEDALNQRPKVEIAKREIKEIRPWAKVKALKRSVFDPDAIQHLKGVDILFGCTDNHSSRLLLNKLSRQYYLPYIDMGTGIFVSRDGGGQKITHMGGQVHVMLPATPCLICRGALDRTAAGEERMDEEQRVVHRQRGYVLGDEIIQPQVVQLNGSIVNQALSEFLNLFTSFKEFAPFLLYDALKPGLLSISVKNAKGCTHCHVAGRGDTDPVRDGSPKDPSFAELTPASPPLPSGTTVPPLNPGLPTHDDKPNPIGSGNNPPKRRLWRFRHGGMTHG